MANDAGSGAVQGAEAGAAFGPYGMAIGAGIGAIGGFLGSREQNKAIREKKRHLARARALATPQHLAEVMQHLQPLFRELVASGMGPAFQTSVAQSLAQHGMTGTGVGEAFRTASEAVPGVAATKMAGSEAQGVVQREIAGELGQAEGATPEENPLMNAILGGARGFLASRNPTGGAIATPSAESMLDAVPVPSGPSGSAADVMGGTPNLTPVTRQVGVWNS